MIYVDDSLVVMTSQMTAWFSQKMSDKFGHSPDSDADGLTTLFTGLEIVQDPSLSRLEIRTPKIYKRLITTLTEVNLAGILHDPPQQPIPMDALTTMAEPVSDDNPLLPAEQYPVRSLLGSAAWITSAVRPAESFAVNGVSRHMHRPTRAVVFCLLQLVAWLVSTKDDPFVLTATDDRLVCGMADASLANDPSSRRSFIGYMLKWGSNTFAWKVSLPKLVSPSTRDSEYMAAIKCARQLIAFGFILRELGIHPNEPLPLYTDSTATVMSAQSDKVHVDSRWMGIRLSWLRQGQLDQLYKLIWCSTAEMDADCLTKILERHAFLSARRKSMNLDS